MTTTTVRLVVLTSNDHGLNKGSLIYASFSSIWRGVLEFRGSSVRIVMEAMDVKIPAVQACIRQSCN